MVRISVTDLADQPPTPQNLTVGTVGEHRVALSWDTVAGAAKYRVDYLVDGTTDWLPAADEPTTASFTVDGLLCETAHQFRVSAYGDGVVHAAEWSEASAPAAATTTTCQLIIVPPNPPLSIAEDAGIGAAVGTVAATHPDGGEITHTLEPAGGAFAIDAPTGAITVAAALDYLTTETYTLTVTATRGPGTAMATVTITVTGVDCANGTVIANPRSQALLVADCRALLAVQAGLEGDYDALNWSDATALAAWAGVTTGGTPSRVTGLELLDVGLEGTIPSALGRLTGLTTLDLSENELTGAVPVELSGLTALTTLTLGGNSLSGCLPAELRALAASIDAGGGTQDLAQLGLAYCDAAAPPAPTGLTAVATGMTSIGLTWAGPTDVGSLTYRVEYRIADPDEDWTEDASGLQAAAHEVAGLACGTAYEFRGERVR